MPTGIPGSGPTAKATRDAKTEAKQAQPKHAAEEPRVAVQRVKQGVRKIEQPARSEDKVTVRAKERLFYGHMIHNKGEVFEMDTITMRKWPLEPGTTNRKGDVVGRENPLPDGDPTVIETPLGQFELPPTVELVDPDKIDEKEMVPAGHKTEHGVKDGNVL